MRRSLRARLVATTGALVFGSIVAVALVSSWAGRREFRRFEKIVVSDAGHTTTTEQFLHEAPPSGREAAFAGALNRGLVGGAAACAGGALLLTLLFSRRIFGPIEALTRAARAMAAGDREARVDVRSADEVGELGKAFNAMSEAVGTSERLRRRLIGDVAHELRTPLATIEGYTEGLLDGVVAPSAETWALLHDEAGRLRRLVQELQELSRAEARQLPLQLRPCPPAELIDQAVRRIASQFAEQGVTLTTDIPAELPPVQADADRIIQVLINLLGNALRYTPAGGSVQMRVERQHGAVAFHVADTGIGIATEHLPHLFERFYRVDKARSRALGGSGIGLTISRAIVEVHDGQIWAASNGTGQGATFSFTLPIALPGSA